MINTLLGIKGEMSTMYDPKGRAFATTTIDTTGCRVTNVKTEEKDGYAAVQLGVGKKNQHAAHKPQLEAAKKLGLEYLNLRHKEVRPGSLGEEVKIGQELNVAEIFNVGEKVTVTGISKGKGFAGGVKRYNFKGGPRTHGQSDRERAPGSSSSGTTPGRLRKGKRMAGRMGSDKVTTKNMTIMKIDTETNRIYLKGAVPGIKGGLLVIRKI